MTHRLPILQFTLSLVLLMVAFPCGAQIFVHDEAVSSDLSDDFDVPDFFTLPEGSSFMRINIGSADIDLFTLQLRESQQLDSVIVRDYQSVLGNISFLGFQTNEILSEPPSENFDDPIDFVIFGDWAINEDILPLMVQTNGDLEAPLRSRNLAFWANETGAPSSFVLEFQTSTFSVVPEPHSGLLIVVTFAITILKRRRFQQ